MSPFDLEQGALRDPGGADAVPHPLLIEAGAGTGKTWALVHLATRLMVEEGVEPAEVLMVTFTRDAARELRGRVRSHLGEVLRALSGDAAEPWALSLAAREPEGAGWRERARHALAHLDELSASTIHSFASSALASPVGHLADVDRHWRQALAEVRARAADRQPDRVGAIDPVTLETVARALHEAGVRGPGRSRGVRVLPDGEGAEWVEAQARLQRDLALEVVARVGELARQHREATFADLLSALDEQLHGDGAARTIADLRHTYRVVMVDEFQDTDPLQWRILSRLFLDAPDTRLVVVGDPKQGIYRFRSAAVEVFLAVRELCRQRGLATTELVVNRRSSAGLLDGLNALFEGVDFHYEVDEVPAEPVIAYAPARASRDEAPGDLVDETGASLVLRAGPIPKGRGGSEERRRVVLGEVVALARRAHGRGVPYREIAVLCQTNRQCAEVQRALARAGVPATTTSGDPVARSEAARQLRHLLVALASPEEVGLVEALRATWFAGDRPEDPADTEVAATVARLGAAVRRDGALAVSRFLREARLLAAVARREEAERHLTDLSHLAELLARDLGAVTSARALLSWLDDLASRRDVEEAATARRLETESDAVRVLTIHKAKGLEFDVVLAPFLGAALERVETSGKKALCRWVEDGEVVIDAASGWAWGGEAAAQERRSRAEADAAGESLRKLYVALTRARRALVAWVLPAHAVPFGDQWPRLLLDRESDGPARRRSLAEVVEGFVERAKPLAARPPFEPARRDPVGALAPWADRGIGVVALGTPVLGAEAGVTVPTSSVPARHRHRESLAPQRRRWSYTEVARELSARVGESFEEAAGLDEAELSEAEALLTATEVRSDVAQVFGSLAGTRVGVVVHRVLELSLGSAEPLDSHLERALAESGLAGGVDDHDRAALASALAAIRSRPLESTLQGRSLADLGGADAAAEMRFVLALGEQARADRLIGAARAAGSEEVEGLFGEYLARTEPFTGQLSEGFLVGSLDLTVRGTDGAYRVLDYKTDQLAGARRPYAPEAMAAHMRSHHYPLQALFYSVALHRFLRERLRGYDPQRHLGGVDYFFVRVVGDGSAEPGDGLLHWDLSARAVVLASDALGEP